MKNKILGICQKCILVYIFYCWITWVRKYADIRKLIWFLLKPLNIIINAFFFLLSTSIFIGEDVVIEINERYKTILILEGNSSLPP